MTLTEEVFYAIAVFATLPWIPVAFGKPLSRYFRWSLGTVVAAEIVQTLFILGLDNHFVTFDYIVSIFTVGVLLCILGGVLAVISIAKYQIGKGCVLTVLFTITCWIFLITVH